MSAISALTLEIHYTIKTVRHVCTFVAVILSIPGLAVVILCAARTSKRYSALIALLIALGVLGDVVLNLIWDPLMLLPELCIMREEPMIPIPGGPNIYYELWAFLISLNIPVFTACFLERHQAVQSAGSRWLLPMTVRHVLIGIMAFFALIISLSLGFAEMELHKEQALLQVIENRWPSIDVHGGKCYDRFPFICFAIACIFGICMCIILTTMVSLHTFALLGVASTLSEAVKRNNRFLSNVLIIQASFPVFLIAFPLIFSLIAVFAGVEGPLPYSLAYLFISAHAPTHSLVLLTVMPMYRRKFVEIVRWICGNGLINSKISALSKSTTEPKH